MSDTANLAQMLSLMDPGEARRTSCDLSLTDIWRRLADAETPARRTPAETTAKQ